MVGEGNPKSRSAVESRVYRARSNPGNRSWSTSSDPCRESNEPYPTDLKIKRYPLASMTEWLIARSIWGIWFRRPSTWIIALALLAFSRWLEAWLPLGLTTEDLQRLSAQYEIAFIGGIVGASTAAREMGQFVAITRDLPPARRVALETVVLVVPAGLIALTILLPAHHFRTWQMGSFHTASAVWGLCLGWLHFCLMATLVLRLAQALDGARTSKHATTGLAALCLLTLAAPGLLVAYGGAAAQAAAMLDVGAPLRASFASSEAQAPYANGSLGFISATHWARSLPILTFALLSAALASPRTPRQTPSHALRDPR